MSQEIDFLAVQQVFKRFVSQPALNLWRKTHGVNCFSPLLRNDLARFYTANSL